MAGTFTSQEKLFQPLREEIIEMYDEGLSLTDISNDVKVTVRGVNKIVNRHGGSGADVVTDDVLHCIEIWKLQRPSTYAREIQNRLLLKGICDRDKLLSISAINRSLSGKLGMTRRSLQVCQKNSMSAIFSFPTLREKSKCLAFQLWYKSIVHLSKQNLSIGSSLVLNFPLFIRRTDY